MYKLAFGKEDKVAEIARSIGLIKYQGNKDFVLEKILREEFQDYSLRHLAIAQVDIQGERAFTSPVLTLYNKKTEEEVVCVVKLGELGMSSYEFYKLPHKAVDD